MEKQIVFFDIDGTLLDEEKRIPESTKMAVRALQENGVYTAIATGRSPYMFDWIREELNIHSYVSINGQYVVFEGEEIYKNPINPEWLESLNEMAAGRESALGYCSQDDIRVNNQNHPFIESSFQSLMMDYPVVDYDFYKNNLIYQGHLYSRPNEAPMFIESFPQLHFVQWHDYAYDILPAGASKAVGIRKLLEALSIKTENSYAFGDGMNDIEMLKSVGTGIAMGNAVPEAIEAADLVTTSSSDDGILNGLIQVGLLDKK
jgi:Cof subfamily protein (haloacid dehalogenase superfamily)